MTIPEYGTLDAVGLAELVRKRSVSPLELLEEALRRNAEVNPRINAVIHLMEAQAREAIRAGLPDGPLCGVPFLLKDLIMAYGGQPMRSGSRLCRQFVPPEDEELVRRHRAAGLVIFGKTNTPEFGLSVVTEPELFGPTRNPWNLERSPGGSSGGAAAAVAARVVPAAAANDGGGSIRTPASACGLVGLKPTRGRNPSGPQLPDVWWGFIAEHAVTRSVRDSAALLDATHGGYPGQLYTLPRQTGSFLEETQREPGRLRITYSLDPGLGTAVHPENRKAVEKVATELSRLGHNVAQAHLPLNRQRFMETYATLLCADTAALVRAAGQARGRAAAARDVELATWVLRCMGEALRGGDVAAALWEAQQFARQWLTWSRTFDVLLTPTVGVPSLPIGSFRLPAAQRAAMRTLSMLPAGALRGQRARLVEAFRPAFEASPYTMIANVTGQPSVSLPLHLTAEGLPLGILLTADLGEEAMLFRLAAQLEATLPWASQRAPHACG